LCNSGLLFFSGLGLSRTPRGWPFQHFYCAFPPILSCPSWRIGGKNVFWSFSTAVPSLPNPFPPRDVGFFGLYRTLRASLPFSFAVGIIPSRSSIRFLSFKTFLRSPGTAFAGPILYFCLFPVIFWTLLLPVFSPVLSDRRTLAAFPLFPPLDELLALHWPPEPLF